ncbi:hypothetical protein PI126_g18522 [Phytophthora idaei]|nr:hypothetical protein PI126_g18522 [Phytophthora idaei]
MDVYYLHLLTTITRPNLHTCIIHLLPRTVAADSMEMSSFQVPAAKSPKGRNAKRADSVVDAFRELLSNEDRTLLAKRQIAFFDESITLKLQKSFRSETEHAVAMSVAALREKKEGVELLISLQRSLSEMRRTLMELTRSGRQQDDAEIIDLQSCIAELRNEMEACI